MAQGNIIPVLPGGPLYHSIGSGEVAIRDVLLRFIYFIIHVLYIVPIFYIYCRYLYNINTTLFKCFKYLLLDSTKKKTPYECNVDSFFERDALPTTCNNNIQYGSISGVKFQYCTNVSCNPWLSINPA